MEFRQLKTFQLVATMLSFHRAAKALNYAQSTVSAQIRSLEEELGVQLFDRLGKHIALTEAGDTLQRYAQKILDMEEETVSEVRQLSEPKAALNIRTPQTIGTYLLPRIVSKFQDRFKRVSLRFERCAFHSLEHELQIGKTDLAFLFIEQIKSANLIAEPLRFETLVMVSNIGNPITRKSSVSFQDLENQPLFLAEADCSYRMALEQTLAEKKIDPLSILEFSSIEMLKKSLEKGTGVTILPEIAVKEEIQEGRLSLLQMNETLMETALLMIRHKDKWISPALGAFMEAARELMGQ